MSERKVRARYYAEAQLAEGEAAFLANNFAGAIALFSEGMSDDILDDEDVTIKLCDGSKHTNQSSSWISYDVIRDP